MEAEEEVIELFGIKNFNLVLEHISRARIQDEHIRAIELKMEVYGVYVTRKRDESPAD